MTCHRAEQLLSDSLELHLPRELLRAITTHVRHCPSCHRLRDELAALGADLRELPRTMPSPAIERRAVELWLADRQTRVRGPSAVRRALPVLAAASCLAAVAAAVLAPALLRSRGASSRTIRQPIRLLDTSSGGDQAAVAVARAPERRWREGAAVIPDLLPFRPGAPGAAGGPRGGMRLAGSGAAPAPRPISRHRGGTGSVPPAAGLEGNDLRLLNAEPLTGSRRWVALPGDEWEEIEARVRQRVRVRDDFVQVPFPRLAAASDRAVAAAAAAYKREAAVVDPRLAREVEVLLKGTALSDLCDRLRADTGIHLAAGPSVADEKVTLLCEKQPLRDVMRQLSRPFGYTWLRSGKQGEYKYELVQDLKSQLVEEELRNRDRHAALLALDREIERYRPLLNLTPDEALARAKSAGAEEKALLEQLANKGWGPLQMYARLSATQMAALRSGQKLTFSSEPGPGELSLPPDIARGVLQSYRDWHVREHEGGRDFVADNQFPEGRPLVSAPQIGAKVVLLMEQSELGEFTINKSGSGFFSGGSLSHHSMITGFALAVGVSPHVRKPDNQATTAKLAGDPALQVRVTVQARPSCPAALRREEERPGRLATRLDSPPGGPGRGGLGSEALHPVTSADVLEALHRATGMPIVADYYTRLYPREQVSAANQSLFNTLNRLADEMRLRWNREGRWLQFRSTSYYDDRLKEIPNRLLDRWTSARQRQGRLTLDDLLEIAGLSDAQLAAEKMAEGARECYGLTEWNLARDDNLRPHLRMLVGLTPAQRQAAVSPAGLPFRRMTLAQQQQFVALGVDPGSASSLTLEALTDAALQVQYIPPGMFGWTPGEATPPLHPSSVCEPTREAALAAARRLDPAAEIAQIVPTVPALRISYSRAGARRNHWWVMDRGVWVSG
jgi:hypothetical protein